MSARLFIPSRLWRCSDVGASMKRMCPGQPTRHLFSRDDVLYSDNHVCSRISCLKLVDEQLFLGVIQIHSSRVIADGRAMVS